MIVWLASYPRSGNTMFRMALKHLYGIDTYSIYADQDIISMGAAQIVGHRRKRIDVRELAKSDQVYFVKTHNAIPGEMSRRFGAIHIVRDGRDTLTSYAHYRVKVNGLKFGNKLATPVQSMDDLLTTSAHIWGGWSGHARAWSDWPGQCTRVRYEDMVRDLRGTVDEALECMQLAHNHLPHAEMPDFGHLKSKWPQFFRKGQVGSWKGFMIEDQLSMFWARHGAMMKELGYV